MTNQIPRHTPRSPEGVSADSRYSFQVRDTAVRVFFPPDGPLLARKLTSYFSGLKD